MTYLSFIIQGLKSVKKSLTLFVMYITWKTYFHCYCDCICV